MAEKPTTIEESLKTMSAVSIQKLILEATAYLSDLSLTTTIAVLKAAVGQKIECHLQTEPWSKSEEVADNDYIQLIATDSSPQKWKALGKFMSTAGNLFERAGIGTATQIVSSGNEDPVVGLTIFNIPLHAQFKEMFVQLMENGERSISAADALDVLTPKEQTDEEDTD